MPTSQRRPVNKHSKRKTHRCKMRNRFLHGLLFVFAALMLCFGLFLWKAALELNAPAESAVSVSAEDFRPVVGDPPYRVAVDAGHGGNDPGARGVVEEKQVTAATAAALLQWLEQDPNYIPLQTRESFDATATPAQRAAVASAQSPQLLLSIHGNSAANGSTAAGFECYPAVPGRTWHQESFYLQNCWPVECRASAQGCAGEGECVTFIIWKTTRSSWWRIPTRRFGLSAALRCWRMWIVRQCWQSSVL